MTAITPDPPGYASLLQDVTDRVATARVRAALSVNRELVLLIGVSARTSPHVSVLKAGEPASSIASRPTSVAPSLR